MKIELEPLPELKKSDEPITMEDMYHIRQLREEGYRYTQIAKAYNRCKATISNYMRRYENGEYIDETIADNNFDYGKLGALKRAGWNKVKLALEFKTTISEIDMRIKELKIIEKRKSSARN